MPGEKETSQPSDVAMWHKLSGAPEGVTDRGIVVPAGAGQRQQAEKDILRARAHRLSHEDASREVRSLARLAASYLLAGDTETARRYLDQAERLLEARGD
jgi:hypothetical protein